MDGIWFKRCPHCGNYMKKTDPEESCMCCACGWQERQERGVLYFCELTNKYCDLAPRL